MLEIDREVEDDDRQPDLQPSGQGEVVEKPPAARLAEERHADRRRREQQPQHQRVDDHNPEIAGPARGAADLPAPGAAPAAPRARERRKRRQSTPIGSGARGRGRTSGGNLGGSPSRSKSARPTWILTVRHFGCGCVLRSTAVSSRIGYREVCSSRGAFEGVTLRGARALNFSGAAAPSHFLLRAAPAWHSGASTPTLPQQHKASTGAERRRAVGRGCRHQRQDPV